MPDGHVHQIRANHRFSDVFESDKNNVFIIEDGADVEQLFIHSFNHFHTRTNSRHVFHISRIRFSDTLGSIDIRSPISDHSCQQSAMMVR